MNVYIYIIIIYIYVYIYIHNIIYIYIIIYIYRRWVSALQRWWNPRAKPPNASPCGFGPCPPMTMRHGCHRSIPGTRGKYWDTTVMWLDDVVKWLLIIDDDSRLLIILIIDWYRFLYDWEIKGNQHLSTSKREIIGCWCQNSVQMQWCLPLYQYQYCHIYVVPTEPNPWQIKLDHCWSLSIPADDSWLFQNHLMLIDYSLLMII